MNNIGLIAIAAIGFLWLRSSSSAKKPAGAGGGAAGGNAGGGGGGGNNYVDIAARAAQMGISVYEYLKRFGNGGDGGSGQDGPGGYTPGEGGVSVGNGDDGSEGQDPGEDDNRYDPPAEEPVDPELPDGWIDPEF